MKIITGPRYKTWDTPPPAEARTPAWVVVAVAGPVAFLAGFAAGVLVVVFGG